MSDKKQCILGENELSAGESLEFEYEKDGYKVTSVYDGDSAYANVFREEYSMIILDIMMPGKDGFEVLKEIRKKSNVPVIMLTAKGETLDKILGLEFGADDYIVKPFEPKELVARIKAVLRRVDFQNEPEQKVSFENLTIDMSTYELHLAGKQVSIPPKELELLNYLCTHPNKVFTRDQLLNEVWGYDYYVDSRTVDVHVKRLREKIDGISDKWELKTVWRVGYKFEVK
ncbi:MAG: response regulator transcription factor [Clostridia bacterium]|nr:response regulator transcription factor [Clostridia bacterium]